MKGTFSVRRAVIHAAGALVVMIVALTIHSIVVKIDAYTAGQRFADYGLLTVAVAVGVSYFFQCGPSVNAALVGGGIIGAGVATWLSMVVPAHGRSGGTEPETRRGPRARATAPRRVVPLTEADKQPLVRTEIAGHARLVHPGLGFSVLAPDVTMTAVPPDQGPIVLTASNDMQGYIYLERTSGKFLFVYETSELPASKEDLGGMLARLEQNLTRGIEHTLGPGRLESLGYGTTWKDGVGTAQLHESNGTAHLRFLAFAQPFGAAWRTVFIVTISATDDSLAGLAESFRPAS